MGQECLCDLSRAHSPLVNRRPAHVERAVVSIRRRLAAHATPQTRYAFVGAATIRAEIVVVLFPGSLIYLPFSYHP
jgi:hypothetical protein